MATPPPDRPHSDAHDPARTRFYLMAATRFGGVALLMAGLFLVAGRTGTRAALPGVALTIAGLVMATLLPLYFARRWRTPKEEGDKTE